jgi:hypothetical protein
MGAANMTASLTLNGHSKAWTSRIGLVVLAGLIAAAIDAAYFSTFALIGGKSPALVLQSIASFWLGKASMDGGAASALLGAATHIGLATLMAAGFFLAAPRVRVLRGNVLAAGVIYGLFLYCVMYLVVMPIRWPMIYPRWDGWRSVLDILVHVMIGIAVALVLRKATGTKAAQLAE